MFSLSLVLLFDLFVLSRVCVCVCEFQYECWSLSFILIVVFGCDFPFVLYSSV